MSNKFEILAEYIKDLSIETPNVETLTFVRENLANYNMEIDISSLVLKNKLLEIITKLTLQDKKDNTEKAFFEIKYATVITLDKSINEMRKLRGREISMIFQNPREALNPVFKISDQLINIYQTHYY